MQGNLHTGAIPITGWEIFAAWPNTHMIIALIIGGIFGYLLVSNWIDVMNMKEDIRDLKNK